MKAYIDQNNQLLEMMKNIKKDNSTPNVYKQDNSNSEIKDSNVINGNNNNIYYINSNQLKESDEDKPKYNRRELKTEIKKILAENRAVYKLYGPTDKNKSDLFSEKPYIWKEKLLSTIVNNRKIVKLLESNSHLFVQMKSLIYL